MLLSIVVAVAVGCGSTSTEPNAVESESSAATSAVDQGQTADSSASAPDAARITEVSPTTTVPTIHEEGPLRKIDTGGAHMDAALRGHLAIVGGCVVQQGLDGQATIVLWPLDVHWDLEAQSVSSKPSTSTHIAASTAR